MCEVWVLKVGARTPILRRRVEQREDDPGQSVLEDGLSEDLRGRGYDGLRIAVGDVDTKVSVVFGELQIRRRDLKYLVE